MSNIVPFIFESHEVRVIANNGDPLFVAKDVATALGYARPNDAVNQHCRGTAERRPLQTSGGVQELRVIREPDLYRLIFGSTLPSAQAFERLVVEEILPSIRKTGAYVSPVRSENSKIEAMLMVARAAADMLRMSETSKIRMLASINETEGLPSTFLPKYVDEPLVRSLTSLLKEHGSSLSAKAANLLLIGMGILEELERTGNSGTIKKFKSLTAEGLKYGRNETSPQEPRETQPLYYVDKFPTLLGQLNEFYKLTP